MGRGLLKIRQFSWTSCVYRPLLNSRALVLAKLPDILIRNDRDVKKLKNDDQVEFYFVNGRST